MWSTSGMFSVFGFRDVCDDDAINLLIYRKRLNMFGVEYT